MIMLKVNKGEVTAAVNGQVIDLLTEIGMGLGQMLYKTLANCPDPALKDTFIKGVFEVALEEMRHMEASDDE